MKLRFLTFIIICVTVLLSCNRIVDKIIKKDNTKYTSPYMGMWSGNYTGDENGSFTFEVIKNGSIIGLRNSTDKIDGGVYSDGNLYNVNSPFTGFSFYGSLESKKGTWIKSDNGGNWTIFKQ